MYTSYRDKSLSVEMMFLLDGISCYADSAVGSLGFFFCGNYYHDTSLLVVM